MNDNNSLADDLILNHQEDVAVLRARIAQLEAELGRCRAANVYDAEAHRRVAQLEAALFRYTQLQIYPSLPWTLRVDTEGLLTALERARRG
jgi:hypothetical protein